jgi:hypothetical protein
LARWDVELAALLATVVERPSARGGALELAGR